VQPLRLRLRLSPAHCQSAALSLRRRGLAGAGAARSALLRFRALAQHRQQLQALAQRLGLSGDAVLAAFGAGISAALGKQAAAVQAVQELALARYGVQRGSSGLSVLAVAAHLEKLCTQVG
jgi:hypothetical protein